MRNIDAEKVTYELTGFIKQSFVKAGFEHAVIAMSGGVDSSTSAGLAVRALGKENVFPILLPYGDLNSQGTKDAKDVVTSLGITNTKTINIKPFVDPMIEPSMDNVRKGNIMARVRMIILFDQAKKRKALVVGTENKSEHLLGYFTRFGDSASDIEPLRNLYKTQVFELAKYLKLPQQVLTRQPTAGLWEGQTDEGEFGFTYKDADEILTCYVDEQRSVDAIVADGFDRMIVTKVIAMADRNAFKHHLPYIPLA